MQKGLLMKTTKLLDTEQIVFQEVSTEWISLELAGERFVLDVDTLHELAFRSASFLSLIESQCSEDICMSEGTRH
ncbi:hypothetical protein BDW_11390 [Bdellovibrio bacteriovorus W]|nr:hypothetical protein BDW_11390 [Bdellovibrio bacteriovorus W]